MNMQKGFKKIIGFKAYCFCLVIVMFSLFRAHCFAQTVLLQDGFDDGDADGWQLETGWQVEEDESNYVLSGSGHSFARVDFRAHNYSLQVKLKLIDGNSGVHINYRTGSCERYFIGFNTSELYLSKTSPCETHTDLARITDEHSPNQWYLVEISGNEGNIKVYVDGVLKINYTDSSPIYSGPAAFETLDFSHVHFDDVVITSYDDYSQVPWVSTGGPLGGLGYDVRIHPLNKNIMFVTDNWAGVVKSDNAGQNWYQTNSGISIKGGATRDAVNIFSLTIDPNDPNIIWAGTFGEGSNFGVFKSVDSGYSWKLKNNGITLDGENGLVFRGFTVEPGNSEVVYTQAEVPTNVQGREFYRVKGRVYKTIDGGGSWRLIWQGDNLARYLIIDPSDHNTLYLSTGIFDREAYNSDCSNGIPGGVGILKSHDGGNSWSPINNGLSDLYVGSLRMHPNNPKILFAATGNNACSGLYDNKITSGLFRTSDGGTSWSKVISNDVITTVNFSPSKPNIAYAASSFAVYRSGDGGSNWKRFSHDNAWGPPGVRAGIPIDLTVDPENPYLIFVNNYGGGVFRSRTGGKKWEIWSKGYAGSDIQQVKTFDGNDSTVYAIGRSGPFVSYDYGANWTGIANGEAKTNPEWYAASINPVDSNIFLISEEMGGGIYRTEDNGRNFVEVLRHPMVSNEPSTRQGFKSMVFAPSDPNIVYVGISKPTNQSSILSSIAPLGTVLYKSINAGVSFAPVSSIIDGYNINELAVSPADPNTVYAATSNGVYKSSNGAADWQHIDSLGNRKIETLMIDPLQPGYIIAGEIFGGIWISADDGASWTGPNNTGFNSPNPYISSLAADPANPDNIFAADLYSGVYVSTDKGHNWLPFPDWNMSGLSVRAVKDIAVNEGTIYAATQGGGVFMFNRSDSNVVNLSIFP